MPQQAASAPLRQPADIRLFGEISKVDDEERMVWGYASTTSKDNQGESVTKGALEAAMPEYMKFANIREMHQPSAVGVAKSAEIDEKGVYIGAHVVDDAAWKKVKSGVYKGFSIGGKSTMKKDGVISGMRLTEISLVDRPANPECVIEVWKGDGMSDPKQQQREAVLALADMLDKGDLDAVALLAFAKGEQGKAITGEQAPAAAVEAAPASTTETVEKGDAAPANEAAPGAAESAPAAEAAPAATAEAAAAQAEPAVTKADGAPAATTEAAPAATTEQPAGEQELKKGLSTTASLALLLKQLGYLCQNQNDELRREKDNSVVPDMLHDLLVQGGKVLVAMATEEAAELANNVDPNSTAEDGSRNYVNPASNVSAFGYADKTGDLAKNDTTPAADALAKAEGALNKASEALEATIAKLDSVTKERDEALAKAAATDAQVQELSKGMKALEERLSKMPRPTPRGSLFVFNKADNLNTEEPVAKADGTSTTESDVVKKADGTVDQEATAMALIMKAHSSGGIPLAKLSRS